MALTFDGIGDITNFDFTAPGDFSIRIPSFTTGAIGNSYTGIILGTQTGNSNFIALIGGSEIRFRIGISINFPYVFGSNQVIPEILAVRVGSTISLSVGGATPVTGTSSISYNLNTYGVYNSGLLKLVGEMAGVVTLIGDSSGTITHNFDTSTGTTLTDTTSAQNGTLNNLSFPAASGVIINGAVSLTALTVAGSISVSSPQSPTINITSPTVNNRVKQRNASNQHSFTVSGSITDLPAGSIVQYNLDGGAFQTLDANPTGSYSGSILVTSTQIIEVRLNDAGTTYSAGQITLLAVANINCDGQSNMAGRATNLQSVTLVILQKAELA